MRLNVLITKEQLEKKTEEIADAITRDYNGKELVLVGVLKVVLFTCRIWRENKNGCGY